MSLKLINRYHFNVNWGGNRTDFLEISGLDIEIETITIRNGSSPEESEIKAPGLLRFSDITLKRTINKGDNDFFNWINTRSFGKVERRDLTISLLNENHEPIIIWKLKNCFPVKYIGPVLLGNNSAFATESLIITHEGMTVESL